ncbi:MAG: DNA mismatch repair protein MutS, partial [Paralcaligenes sp.]
TLFATHYFEITRLPNEVPAAANVHLAAAESASGVIFLHQVQPGPASRSYGIQVAQRAGIPAAVIRRASQELARLEAQGAPTPQLDLFATPVNDSLAPAHEDGNEEEGVATHGKGVGTADSALEAELANTDPDQLTPREALDFLYHLKNTYL